MGFINGVGSLEWRRAFHAALIAGLALACGKAVFMSSDLDAGCVSVYAAGTDTFSQDEPVGGGTEASPEPGVGKPVGGGTEASPEPGAGKPVGGGTEASPEPGAGKPVGGGTEASPESGVGTPAGGDPKAPAEGDQETSVEGGSGGLFFYIAMLLALACAALGVVLERALRWKRKLAGEPPRVVELDVNILGQLDQNSRLNEDLKKAFNLLVKQLGLADQATREELNKLAASVGVATNLAEERKQEVLRYQEGHDWAVNRTFIRGVIDSLDFIEDLQDRGDESEGLGYAKQKLVNLLDNNGIEVFEPPVGSLYEDHSSGAEVVEAVTVSGEKPAGRITEVRRPGYRLALGVNESKVVRSAEVAVSIAEKVDHGNAEDLQAHETEEEFEENNEGNEA